MPVFDTETLNERTMAMLSPDQASWIYNGLDCCVTFEVNERLEEELYASGNTPEVEYTYRMALAKQAPYLEMSMRGIRIDEGARQTSIAELQRILDGLESRFQRLMQGAFDHGLNWRSPAQLKTFFYGELNIKEIKKRNAKGIYVATVDEEALNRLQLHFYAQPFAKYILAMREIGKKVTFLKTKIDPDHRIRTSINVAGTDTGRLSSSSNDFGTGTNLQNVDRTMRAPFICDPQMLLVEFDLEQADARNVGAIIWNMFLDEAGPEVAGAFLDACESGDLHTSVAQMCFPELPWPEDRNGWKAVAKTPFIGDKSYRDGCKALGHGTNYLGQPPTMSKHTGFPTPVIKDFQRRYFSRFPLIQKWQQRRIEEIKNFGVLTTMFGRRRFFFGRGADASTHRAAIAYEPQSMTGHEMDMGVLNVWRQYPVAELLMQVHDSILLQVPFHNHQTHVERVYELLHYRHTLRGGRELCVPLGGKAGWNWGMADPKTGQNPFGMVEWAGQESRRPPATKRLADFLK